jgi:hypothetical protein
MPTATRRNIILWLFLLVLLGGFIVFGAILCLASPYQPPDKTSMAPNHAIAAEPWVGARGMLFPQEDLYLKK